MPEQVVVPANSVLTRASPNDDFNRYIQEMESLIKEFELFLMGYAMERDANGRMVFIEKYPPKVNEAGKNAIMNWLRTYLNPNTYMSMVKSADTKNNYLIDIEEVSNDLIKNHKKYALSHADYRAVHAKIAFIFFMALKKAETDKEFIFPSMKTNYSPSEQPKPKGLFGGVV